MVGERQCVVVDREADELVGEADEEARRAARGGELGGGEEAERADGGGERLQQEERALAEAKQRREAIVQRLRGLPSERAVANLHADL